MTYDINRLWIERQDLYDRTKLPKGHPNRLTLPKAKRIAQQAHCYPPGLVETDASGKLTMLITGGCVYHGEDARRVAERYIQMQADRIAHLVADAKLVADRYIARAA